MANAKGMRPTAVETTSHYYTKISYNTNLDAEYMGKATIGTAASDGTWQIKKFTYDVDGNVTDIQYANGTDAFDKTYDDRATYSYS